MDGSHECWQPAPDSALVWTQPHALIGGFARLLAGEEADAEQLLLEVDQFCDQLRMAASRARHVFVATWVLPPHHRGLGMIDLTHAGGAGGALLRMNARLVQNLAGERNVIVLDAQRWMTSAGKAAYNARLWFMAKVPFANAVLSEAVADVKAALCGIAGKARKLVIVDLDDRQLGRLARDAAQRGLRVRDRPRSAPHLRTAPWP